MLDPATRANPLVAALVRRNPPADLAEVARRYGDLLDGRERTGNRTAKRRGSQAADAGRIADVDSEELRQVFYGPVAPPDVPRPTCELLMARPGAGRDRRSGKIEELRRRPPLAPRGRWS